MSAAAGRWFDTVRSLLVFARNGDGARDKGGFPHWRAEWTMEPTMTRRRPAPSPLVGAALALLVGCRPAPVDPPTAPPPPEEVWIDASCELCERLQQRVDELRAQGVVEVVGGQPFRWEFDCEGDTLAVTVHAADLPGEVEPILWLGAGAAPPRIVPVRLRVGSGQPQLEQRLARCDGGEPVRFHVDLATGVVWGDE
jgi:hypothetical protein